MKLKNHEEVKTNDGSITVYSKKYNENAHSIAGAMEETQVHYIQGCKVNERSSLDECFNILEVGFGAGIGFLKTYEALANKLVHMTSLEIDEELVHYFNEKSSELKLVEKTRNIFEFKKDQFTLEVIIGDARETMNSMDLKYHAIYQDAYSPRHNPRLWTVEWFKQLKERADKEVIISTYSANSSIRKSMIEAGFKVYNGEKFGQKKTSTRATLMGETSSEIMEKLKRSPQLALWDKDCDAYMDRD